MVIFAKKLQECQKMYQNFKYRNFEVVIKLSYSSINKVFANFRGIFAKARIKNEKMEKGISAL
jgi:hypothetical protein